MLKSDITIEFITKDHSSNNLKMILISTLENDKNCVENVFMLCDDYTQKTKYELQASLDKIKAEIMSETEINNVYAHDEFREYTKINFDLESILTEADNYFQAV